MGNAQIGKLPVILSCLYYCNSVVAGLSRLATEPLQSDVLSRAGPVSVFDVGVGFPYLFGVYFESVGFRFRFSAVT